MQLHGKKPRSNRIKGISKKNFYIFCRYAKEDERRAREKEAREEKYAERFVGCVSFMSYFFHNFHLLILSMLWRNHAIVTLKGYCTFSDP